MNAEQPQTAGPAPKNARRRGIVLVAVLVIIACLSYAGYQYSDMMVLEYQASENSHRMVQARRLAESGVHYTAAILSNPDNVNAILNGNPFNNPEVFKDKAVPMDGLQGRFSIISPPDPDGGATDLNYGVTDEAGKINLNALMKNDPTGELAFNVLMLLPNMTEDIAHSIVAWMGGSFGIDNGGAQNDYYTSQSPSYRMKNGPIDSIDELLLVRGVTVDLLYGNDWNRNGIQDGNEGADGGGFNRGWFPYLTVHSREQNRDKMGKALVYLNDPDLLQLYQQLPAAMTPEMAKFIMLYRLKGPSNPQGNSQGLFSSLGAALGGGSSSSNNNSNSNTVQGDLSGYTINEADLLTAGKGQINSLFDLVNAQVSIQSKDDKGNAITVIYSSPLSDVDGQRANLPTLFATTTTSQDTDIPARVNVTTAPRTVLKAIGFSDTDVEKIVSARDGASSSFGTDDIYSSLTWLLTEAQVSQQTLSGLEKLITARSQVYRVQSVGYFDGGKGGTVRVEAVIDTNNGRPRIIAWRDLSELGKGISDTAPAK